MSLPFLMNFEIVQKFIFYFFTIYKQIIKIGDLLKLSSTSTLNKILKGSVNEEGEQKIDSKKGSTIPPSRQHSKIIYDILILTGSNTLTTIVLSAALFIYDTVNNPLYYNMIYLVVIFTTFILITILSIIKALSNPLFRAPKIAEILKFAVYLTFVFIVVFYYIAPYMFPPFEITELEDGDSVGQLYTVYGHGAIPGSTVSVYVIDDLGHEWLQNTVNTTQDGKWECDKIIFGEDRHDDIGKKFVIYATLDKNNEIYETPHIIVTRS